MPRQPRLLVEPPTWLYREGRASRSWFAAAAPAGTPVRLPHCWNTLDDFHDGVEYRRGWGSYRADFDLPATRCDAADRWFLVTEGFFGFGDLFVNGSRLAAVDGQYLGVRVEVTDRLRPGARNTLGLRLCNRHRRAVLPGIRDPDFLLYGGLSGRAWLERCPTPCLDAARIRIHAALEEANAGRVDIECETDSSSALAGATVEWTVLAPGGGVAARGVMACGLPGLSLHVGQALLWSDETPCLYTVRGALNVSGRGVTDVMETRIGFRDAEFLPRQGFFLNGRRTELRGCNRHECMPGFGRALPAGIHREDAARIKRMGLNFVRLSHYPQSPAFLDACDELGILVYAEIATWKSVRGWGGWLRAATRQMEAMVRRDRHRPGVILWGMGNESRSRRAYRVLRETVRVLDPARPVIYAENHIHRARRHGTTDAADVWGLNYELEAIEEGCRAARLANVVVAECANRPETTRGSRARELDQVRAIDDVLSRIAGLPHVAGFALWSFNDYGTLRKKRYARHCGLVDAWRSPKMAADYLAARFRPEAFVRLVADWRVAPAREGGGDERDVVVFTNCDTLRFFVGGVPAGEMRGANPLAVKLPFRDGALEVRALRGTECASDVCLPWGPAARLTIVPSPEGDANAANADVLCFDVLAADAHGRPVLDWAGDARVTCDGPAAVRSHTPAGAVRLAGGRGRVFVEPRGAGLLTLRAEALRLDGGELTVAMRGA